MRRLLIGVIFALALVSISSVTQALKAPGPINPPPPPPLPTVYYPTGPAAPLGFAVDRDVSDEPDGNCVGQPHDVCARWVNGSTASTASLQRGPAQNGPWTQVAFRSTGLTKDTTTEMFDLNPPVDARVCYRVVLSDNWGSTSSPVKCVYTRDGLERSLWRARVRLRTSTLPGSSSDAGVQVRLQSPVGLDLPPPTGNETWLDTPLDDFAGGSDVWYELSTKGLGDVSDVTQLTIDLEGSDDLCLREIELELNGRRAYQRDVGPAACMPVTDGTNLFITHDELRASPDWQSMGFPNRPPFVDYAWLEAVTTSIIGDVLHDYDDIHFASPGTDGNPVVEYVDASTVRFEYSFWKDSVFPITLSFDLVTSTWCEAGMTRGSVSVDNINADTAGWLYLVYPFAEAVIEYYEPSADVQLDVDIPIACNSATPLTWCVGFDAISGLGPILCSNLPN